MGLYNVGWLEFLKACMYRYVRVCFGCVNHKIKNCINVINRKKHHIDIFYLIKIIFTFDYFSFARLVGF